MSAGEDLEMSVANRRSLAGWRLQALNPRGSWVAMALLLGGCASSAPASTTGDACRVQVSPCRATQVAAVSEGTNPYLTFSSAEEIFYQSFDANRLTVLARIALSTNQKDVLVRGIGSPTYGGAVVSADEENFYLVLPSPEGGSALMRLARGLDEPPVALNSTASSSSQEGIGRVLMVGDELYYSVIGTFLDGKGGPPAGLIARDKVGGAGRVVWDAYSGRSLRRRGDSLFFAYLDAAEFDPTKTSSAALVRMSEAGEVQETMNIPSQAASQLEVGEDAIYWVEANRLMTLPLGGGSPRAIFTAPGVLSAQFLVDANYAFMSLNSGGADPALAKTELIRVPLDGGPASRLFQSTEFNDLGQLVILEDAIYFALNAPVPSILKVPRCGCGSALETVTQSSVPSGIPSGTAAR